MGQYASMLECVINVSTGDESPALMTAGGISLLDVHRDVWHNRSVLTLAGPDVEQAARQVAAAAVATLDLRRHVGVHPRIGVVDVVPFVPLGPSTMPEAVAARDRFVAWASTELALPCFVYGPERSLPDIRRLAFTTLTPDAGPATAHPTAGACAVGARPLLVAYNLWLASATIDEAKALARSMRTDEVRALGLVVGDEVQVSMNLINPARFGPAAAFDAVANRSAIARAELVGLLPASVLAEIPPARWTSLDVGPSRTIEARLEQAGLNGGSGGEAAGGSWHTGVS